MLRELFADIDEGIRRIRSIVSDLRAFAYPSEADKRSVFPLSAAIQSALNFTAHELRNISVEQDLNGNPVVQGSRSHIVQILVNLMTNAARAIQPISASRHGRVRIRGTASHGRLYVSVWDNGIGMDTKTLARIFEPFFTTRDVGQGMGLGLSICHTIVANHGGQLTAKSQPGEWTEMTFDLPLADATSVALAV
jgi:two-component system sensor histidine kinase PhcS